MAARKLDTEVRQEQIARAALDIVARHGIKGLSVAAVAREVGIVPSAIYRHFRSKDDVIDAVLALVRGRLEGNVKAVREETADPFERLRRLLVRHVALVSENRAILRIIISEAILEGRPERRASVHHILWGYLAEVAEIVRLGQEAGQIRSDVAAEALAVMFLGLIQSAAILWHVSDGAFDIAGQAERAWLIFSDAIRKH